MNLLTNQMCRRTKQLNVQLLNVTVERVCMPWRTVQTSLLVRCLYVCSPKHNVNVIHGSSSTRRSAVLSTALLCYQKGESQA